MHQDDRSVLLSRIGTFFILLGLIGFILFVISDVANKTNFGYFIPGLILIVIGLVLKKTTSVPPPQNKRFEGIRKWQQHRRDAKAKNDKNKKH